MRKSKGREEAKGTVEDILRRRDMVAVGPQDMDDDSDTEWDDDDGPVSSFSISEPTVQVMSWLYGWIRL